MATLAVGLAAVEMRVETAGLVGMEMVENFESAAVARPVVAGAQSLEVEAMRSCPKSALVPQQHRQAVRLQNLSNKCP